MKTNNTEKLRSDVENMISEIFFDVDTSIERTYSHDGIEIYKPVTIKRNGKPFISIETTIDCFILWDSSEEYKVNSFMYFSNYKNKTTLLCDLVKWVMSQDKYSTIL